MCAKGGEPRSPLPHRFLQIKLEFPRQTAEELTVRTPPSVPRGCLSTGAHGPYSEGTAREDERPTHGLRGGVANQHADSGQHSTPEHPPPPWASRLRSASRQGSSTQASRHPAKSVVITYPVVRDASQTHLQALGRALRGLGLWFAPEPSF